MAIGRKQVNSSKQCDNNLSRVVAVAEDAASVPQYGTGTNRIDVSRIESRTDAAL